MITSIIDDSVDLQIEKFYIIMSCTKKTSTKYKDYICIIMNETSTYSVVKIL